MEIPSNLSSKLPKAMAPSSTTANTNQNDPLQHPLQATAMAIQGAAQGEGRAPRLSHMQSSNEGPADIIAKVSGAVQGGKREDDGAYFTNNEGIPWPDPYVPRLRYEMKTCADPVTASTARPLEESQSPAMCSFSSMRYFSRASEHGYLTLIRKQQTFNRSKNLERVVHPSGSGAFGYFECTKNVSDLTVGFTRRKTKEHATNISLES